MRIGEDAGQLCHPLLLSSHQGTPLNYGRFSESLSSIWKLEESVPLFLFERSRFLSYGLGPFLHPHPSLGPALRVQNHGRAFPFLLGWRRLRQGLGLGLGPGPGPAPSRSLKP